jgi:hypothetical protein
VSELVEPRSLNFLRVCDFLEDIIFKLLLVSSGDWSFPRSRCCADLAMAKFHRF